MSKISIVGLLSGLLLAVHVHAAPNWEIDERALPPGVTKQRALQMLEQADAATAAENQREQQAFEQRGKRVERAAQKYTGQLRRAVDADPQLKAQAQQLEARMQAMAANGEAPPEQRESLAAEARTFYGRAAARAGIDQNALHKDIRAAIQGPVRSRGTEPVEVSFTADGAAVIEHPEEPEPAPGVLSRGVNTVALEAPFPYSEISTGIGSSSGVTNKDNGRYRTWVSQAFVGSGTNRRGLAHFLTVPPQTTGIRVMAQLPETYYTGTLINAFGGAGHTLTSRIEVLNGSTVLCRRSYTHLDHWWVVTGWISKTGLHNVALDCTLSSVPAAGTDVVIRFIGQISSYAWGGAGSSADVDATPKNIRIEVTTADRIRRIR
ncbi:MAG: hypothetical protein ACNA7W_19590 [Pseudomonadales bacterium]